jgi:phosphohistidine phosphatase SixA
MQKLCILLVVAVCLTSCTQRYYVVRHAEKAVPDATMGNDVPLSAEGEQRALALKEKLLQQNISYIYATNYKRTRATAAPLATALDLQVSLYNPADTAFVSRLKMLRKNTLIVGHSNTVDDLVNKLCNAVKVPADLKDNEYDNLYLIRYNRFLGTKIKYTPLKYGTPSH